MQKKPILVASAVLAAALAVTAYAQSNRSYAQSNRSNGGVVVSRSDARKAQPAPQQNFTGKVTITPLFDAKAPGRTGGALVTFQPGARTAWHTHPFGQSLVVTDGTGWIGQWGGPTQEFGKGDVVRIPAGVRHWHGASPNSAMSHIAIHESLNGSPVKWMEKVSDEQYRKNAPERKGE